MIRWNSFSFLIMDDKPKKHSSDVWRMLPVIEILKKLIMEANVAGSVRLKLYTLEPTIVF
ncbi:hypothetical protein C5470_14065 [Photorhabdus stackebrandtii]|uniref:Uncharacterized protein n=1 Tax=Photorhabdus stackebrandtii TaxID=1123042 RepID=A0A7X5TM79_9GAMM|nr:hypothetical protein [Photorhabdus stackebrandtii]